MKKPKVVILGAGFGGLTAAKSLEKVADVTLVDRHNFQTFLPLLYQVSTAGLAADHVAYPIRGALRKKSIQFRMGSPTSINYHQKTVQLDSNETLSFDFLIIALGSATNDFGISGVAQHALGMKTVTEALTIRANIMRKFEDLCRFDDETRLSISVIGGGPTGVELAGAIAELARGPLKSDNPDAAKRIQVSIIEAGPRLLPSFAPSLSERTKKDLEKLGVGVLTNASVAKLEENLIHFRDGSAFDSQITIWAAGVMGEPIINKFSLPIEFNRIAVEETLQVKEHPVIFAIGDIAATYGKDGKLLPMVAPVAMQQGRFISRQILLAIKGQKLKSFTYVDKGAMATIGKHKAVVEVKKFKLSGAIAWYAWLWLHLFYLLGGRNKLATTVDWMWNYLTYDRGNRHIIDIG
ncbi:MAG: NAD(P)/FAD-dependent oxidoreductase [Candidatus Nanopelagicaceae bacterium]